MPDEVIPHKVQAAKGETERMRARRPGDSRTHGKRWVYVGIATLDNNRFIPILNIPDLPQNKMTNLSTTLSTLTSGINLLNNETGHSNGIASLDANGKLNTNQLPSLAIDTVTTVQTVADRNN